jgi:hypothetical protein
VDLSCKLWADPLGESAYEQVNSPQSRKHTEQLAQNNLELLSRTHRGLVVTADCHVRASGCPRMSRSCSAPENHRLHGLFPIRPCTPWLRSIFGDDEQAWSTSNV